MELLFPYAYATGSGRVHFYLSVLTFKMDQIQSFQKKHCFLSLYLWTPLSATPQLLCSPTTGRCLLQLCQEREVSHKQSSEASAQLSCSKKSPLAHVPDTTLKFGHPRDTSRLTPARNVKQILNGRQFSVVWGFLFKSNSSTV